jgi:hypothetical protein
VITVIARACRVSSHADAVLITCKGRREPEEKTEIDAEVSEAFVLLIEGQRRTDVSLGKLIATVQELAGLTEKRAVELHTAQMRSETAITKYVEAADARMRRIEDNLDALIRAITSEQAN